MRFISLFTLLLVWPIGLVAQAADEYGDVRTIRSLPKTQLELGRLHNESRSNQCEPMAEGQSLETTNFAIIKTARESVEKNPRPAARHSVISVGLTMDSSDRAALPLASRSKIIDYMEEHYVSVQVRVRRDLINSKLYFHHRPIAATAKYRGSKVTEQFEPLVQNAVREFRSAGLYTKSNPEDRKAEDLRTLVLVFKNTIIKPGERTGSQYEYAFVRGRESDSGSDERLKTHVFVTAQNGTQLVYLNPYHRPQRADECSIRGNVTITDFDDHTGAIPKESATRSYRLDARRFFPLANIDAYCKEHNLPGGFHENVDTVLDVLIDQMKE